jgi:hypothetical protein
VIVNSKAELLFQWLRCVCSWALFLVIMSSFFIFLLKPIMLWIKYGESYSFPSLRGVVYFFLFSLAMGLIAGTYTWLEAKKKSDWIK